MEVMYTNADQLLNKMHDLEVHIHTRRPDIIVVTEVIPKAQSNPIPKACLVVKGFTEFLNFDCDLCGTSQQGRGIAVYVKEGMKAFEVKSHTSYRDQLWLRIELNKYEHLLLGAIYRSPSLKLEDTVPEIIDSMQKAASYNPPYLIICGDFNIKNIDWKDERCLPGASLQESAFLQGIKDCLLFQHITECTRFRLGHRPQTLDLLFSNEEDIVQDTCFLPGLGLSDHISIHFSIACGRNDRKEGNIIYKDWNQADYMRMNNCINACDLENAIEDKNVQEAWNMISNTLEEIVLLVVPEK